MRNRQVAAGAGVGQCGATPTRPCSAIYGTTSARKMPKKGAGKTGELDPRDLPNELQTALYALYSHYEEEYEEWERAGIEVPPVFIVVCNNTSTSKLVYEWISGWRARSRGRAADRPLRPLKLFSQFDDQFGNPLPRMNTLLIDSRQIEAGNALEPDFRKAAETEIERFRREKARVRGRRLIRSGPDSEILREVMNTVGKEGRLGEQIRCVVSVVDAHRGLGHQHALPTYSASALSEPNCFASR